MTASLRVRTRGHILDRAVIVDIQCERRRHDLPGSVPTPASLDTVGRDLSQRAFHLARRIAVRGVTERSRLGQRDRLLVQPPAST